MPARNKCSLEDIYNARVIKHAGECWEWKGAKTSKGYGQLQLHRGSKKFIASRFSWELHRGPIPTGLFVCHHCDNPPCTNPDHLFLGDHKANADDAQKKGRLPKLENNNRFKTHCRRGHLFDEKNTYWVKRGEWRERHCKICNLANQHRYLERQRQKKKLAHDSAHA